MSSDVASELESHLLQNDDDIGLNTNDIINLNHYENEYEELKEVLRGAWPQTVVIFCRIAITVTDTAILGRLGTNELAAAAFGDTWIQLTGGIVWAGCGDGLISLTSQAMGAGNRELAGIWLQTSLFGAFCISIPVGISWFFLGDFLDIVNIPTEDRKVLPLCSQYGKLSTIWLIPDAITSAYCQWMNGLDIVRFSLPIHVGFVFYNLVANIIFVHGITIGNTTIAGLGFIGSPLATASTTILRLLCLVYFMRPHIPEGVWTGWTLDCISRDRVKVFLAQAIPTAAVSFLEQLQFVVLTLLIAAFGKDQLAAHSAMMNVFDLFTAGIFGMSEGGAMKIGHQLGADKPKSARKLSIALIKAMGIMGIFVALLFLLSSNYLGYVFSKNDLVVHYMSQLSILSGAAYMFLTVTFSMYAILQGQGRPERAVTSMFFGVWGVGIPFAFIISRPLHVGWLGVWIGSLIGYMVMTILMMISVWQSNWSELAKLARHRAMVDDTGSDVQ